MLSRKRKNSGKYLVPIAKSPAILASALAKCQAASELPTVPLHNTAALTLRFLCDDIKAMYSEAAQADGPPPSSRQIDMWFWSQTTAGKLLVVLRSVALQSGNNALRTVGGRFFVPTPYLEWRTRVPMSGSFDAPPRVGRAA